MPNIFEILELFRECIGFIIHEQVGIQKLSYKWLLKCKCLNANQKWYWVDFTMLIFQQFKWLTDEYCAVTCHFYETAIVQKPNNSLCNGNTWVLLSWGNSKLKSYHHAFRNKEDIFYKYLQKCQVFIARYYSNLLCQLKGGMKKIHLEGCREIFSFCRRMHLLIGLETKGFYFFY